MLQEEEWDFMLEMIGVLGPFYEFTQILGASDYVTINLVYPLINTLKEECKNTTNNVYDYEVDFESTDDVFDVVYEEEAVNSPALCIVLIASHDTPEAERYNCLSGMNAWHGSSKNPFDNGPASSSIVWKLIGFNSIIRAILSSKDRIL
ncbi:15007_t:CDS:2 [Entrophospora sp. SA101]|nr:15007_t:CDS:2 [Entrophospora sp. SA101]